MNTDRDIGREAVLRIAENWQVDEDRLVWTENGFDWWPGSFKVSVNCLKSDLETHGDAWRLTARTALFSNVSVDDPKTRNLIGILSNFAPTYAWVYAPVELAEQHKELVDRTVWLQSTVYLREDTAEWLPEFFGRLAILQPIHAQSDFEPDGQLLGAQPDFSFPPESTASDHIDDMLNVADALYIPAGQQPSRWEGSDEFGELAEQYGRNDMCFGHGDPKGVTLETPIGSDSALIRLHTNSPHPILGSGLLATLQLPFWKDEMEITDECMWLNYIQSWMWTDFPQLGSWFAKDNGDGQWESRHSMFFPNALYKPGLATNAALWQVGHARWVKQKLWPDLVDLTMLEIMEKRENIFSST